MVEVSKEVSGISSIRLVLVLAGMVLNLKAVVVGILPFCYLYLVIS